MLTAIAMGLGFSVAALLCVGLALVLLAVYAGAPLVYLASKTNHLAASGSKGDGVKCLVSR